jgi:ribosomal protein S6--L-glutamate ligase
MRIAILGNGIGWHVNDLCRAARQLGHDAMVVPFESLGASVSSGSAILAECDSVIVRTMPLGSLEQVVFRMDVLQRLQASGLMVLNPPRALETCIDKYLTSAKLAAAGLPVPRTFVCQRAKDALAAFEELGRDVVVKPLFGSEGRGMVRVKDKESAWRVFHALEQIRSVLYVQEYLPLPGWDLRVFVSGMRVLGGMRRYAPVHEWRTNVAQGGRVEAVEVAESERALALAATRAVDAIVSGVDLAYGRQGTGYVLEVNAVPGWRAFAKAHGIDIAAEIVRVAARKGEES